MNDVSVQRTTPGTKLATGTLDPRIAKLLDRIDSAAGSPSVDRRSDPRLKYRGRETFLNITHPGGGTIKRRVISINLSARGIAVLESGFLHTGTNCVVHLQRHSGGYDTHPARVRQCRHIGGSLHLIGIQFNERIFPKLYLDPSDWGKLAQATKVDAKALRGRVLMLDDEEIDRTLFEHFLGTTKMECTAVATASEALDAIKQAHWDTVIVDLNLAVGSTGEQVIEQLRSAGFKGPVIAATSEENPQRLRAAWSAGVVAILQKPYTPQQLIGVLADNLASPSSLPSDQAVYSTLYTSNPTDADPTPLVAQYLTQVNRLTTELEEAKKAQSVDKVRRICKTLKGSGSGYGFAVVTSVSEEVLRSLDASGSLSTVRPELEQLESICRRLVAGKAPS